MLKWTLEHLPKTLTASLPWFDEHASSVPVATCTQWSLSLNAPYYYQGEEPQVKLYVGNLAYSISDDDLREAFASYGQVDSARVVTDRDTNRSRGFGFVEMAEDAGRNAIQGLDGRDLQGRALTVNEARPQEDRPRRQFRPDGGSRSGGHRRF